MRLAVSMKRFSSSVRGCKSPMLMVQLPWLKVVLGGAMGCLLSGAGRKDGRTVGRTDGGMADC